QSNRLLASPRGCSSSGTEHIPGSPKAPAENIPEYASDCDNNDCVKHKMILATKGSRSSICPRHRIYIVMVVDVPARAAGRLSNKDRKQTSARKPSSGERRQGRLGQAEPAQRLRRTPKTSRATTPKA